MLKAICIKIPVIILRTFKEHATILLPNKVISINPPRTDGPDVWGHVTRDVDVISGPNWVCPLTRDVRVIDDVTHRDARWAASANGRQRAVLVCGLHLGALDRGVPLVNFKFKEMAISRLFMTMSHVNLRN